MFVRVSPSHALKSSRVKTPSLSIIAATARTSVAESMSRPRVIVVGSATQSDSHWWLLNGGVCSFSSTCIAPPCVAATPTASAPAACPARCPAARCPAAHCPAAHCPALSPDPCCRTPTGDAIAAIAAARRWYIALHACRTCNPYRRSRMRKSRSSRPHTEDTEEAEDAEDTESAESVEVAESGEVGSSAPAGVPGAPNLIAEATARRSLVLRFRMTAMGDPPLTAKTAAGGDCLRLAL